jgi:hypothetical protein
MRTAQCPYLFFRTGRKIAWRRSCHGKRPHLRIKVGIYSWPTEVVFFICFGNSSRQFFSKTTGHYGNCVQEQTFWQMDAMQECALHGERSPFLDPWDDPFLSDCQIISCLSHPSSFPDPSAQLSLATDASNSHVGAVRAVVGTHTLTYFRKPLLII